MDTFFVYYDEYPRHGENEKQRKTVRFTDLKNAQQFIRFMNDHNVVAFEALPTDRVVRFPDQINDVVLAGMGAAHVKDTFTDPSIVYGNACGQYHAGMNLYMTLQNAPA